MRHAALPPGSAEEEPGDAGEAAGLEGVDRAHDREGHHHRRDDGNDPGRRLAALPAVFLPELRAPPGSGSTAKLLPVLCCLCFVV